MYGMEIPRKGPIRRKGYPDGNLKIGYVWESTIPGHAPILKDQLEDVQHCHRIFHDKVTFESCVESPRTQLVEMQNFLRDGDTVVVHGIDCLGTTLLKVIDFVDELLSRGCIIQVPRDNMDTSNPDTFAGVACLIRGLWGIVENNAPKDQKNWLRKTCN